MGKYYQARGDAAESSMRLVDDERNYDDEVGDVVERELCSDEICEKARLLS